MYAFVKSNCYSYNGILNDYAVDGSFLHMKAPPSLINIIISLMSNVDSNITEDNIRSIHLHVNDQYKNQKQNKTTMNTAKDLSIEDRFKEMIKTDQYSVSQSMFRDSRDAIDLYEFLEREKQKKAEEDQTVLELAQNDILSLLLDKITLTKAYVGLHSSPIVIGPAQKDDITSRPDKSKKDLVESDKKGEKTPAKEKATIKLEPDPDSPAGQEKKKGKETKDNSKKEPILFKDLVATCKEFLKVDQEDKAFEYAKQYLATANYIPKKEGKKPLHWEDKKIKSWLNDLKNGIKLSELKTDIPFVEDPKKDKKDNSNIKPLVNAETDIGEKNEKLAPLFKHGTIPAKLLETVRSLKSWLSKAKPEEETAKVSKEDEKSIAILGKFKPSLVKSGLTKKDYVNFALPKQTVEQETLALNVFAKRYLQLISNGSEDAKIVEQIVPIFFAGRGYSEEQYNNWINAIKSAKELSKINKIDHLSVLGVPAIFFPEGLTEPEISEKDFISLLSNLDEKAIEDYLSHIAGKTTKGWDKLGEASLPTDAHAFDYINNSILLLNEEKENAINEYSQNSMETLCETAFMNDVSEEDFVKEHKDLLLKPNGEWRNLTNDTNGYVAEIKEEANFVKWVKEFYEKPELKEKKETKKKDLESQKENGSVVEESEDRRVTMLYSAFEDKLKSFQTFDLLLKDKLIQDFVKNGVIIDAYNDPDHKLTTIEYFDKKTSKDLLVYLKHHYKRIHEPKITPADIFEDGSVRVYSFTQLQEEGNKLVKSGKTREEMIDWVSKNILNRQLEDQPDEKSVHTKEDLMPSLVDSLFSFGNKKEVTMTEEVADDAINKMLKDEKMSLMQVVKAAIDIDAKKGGSKSMTQVHKEIMNLAKTVCPDKYKQHQKNVKEKNKKNKTFVQEKFSKLYPEDWANLKESIKTLDDLYNACVIYKDRDDWKTGLTLALEIISLGTIVEAKEWDAIKITDWYNTEIFKVSEEKSKEEKKPEEKPKLEENVAVPVELNDLMNAASPKRFKRSLDDVVKNFKDTQEARKNIINAIKLGSGKHTRKISKMSEKDIHDMINSSKKRVDLHSNNTN